MADRGWGSKGNKMKLPGVRASGLGRRKTAGVSVYVPATLMICASELNSVTVGLLKWGQLSVKEISKSQRQSGGLGKVETSRVLAKVSCCGSYRRWGRGSQRSAWPFWQAGCSPKRRRGLVTFSCVSRRSPLPWPFKLLVPNARTLTSTSQSCSSCRGARTKSRPSRI